MGDTWIFTKDGYEHIKPEDNTCITIESDENGRLHYKKIANKYNAAIEQDPGAPIFLSTSRSDFYYEEGTAKIENNKLITLMENSYTISDKFDLDDIFDQLKSMKYREVEDFATVDELLEANKNK